MQWFTNWWEMLSPLQQCFAAAAIPATVILLLQTILLLFGIGSHAADHGEMDHDVDYDHDIGHDLSHDFDRDLDHGFDHDTDHAPGHDGAHHASGLRLFTLRGFIALFAVGGWLGISMCDLGLSPVFCILIACGGGFAALLLAALIIGYCMRLQESGNISAANAIAHTATVYIPIPPSRRGSGKVTMNLQERFVEMEALTDHEQVLPTGTTVQIVSVSDKNELIVRPIVR